MNDDCIKQLKAVEDAIVNLSYPTSGRCSDLYVFLDSLRQIGQGVVLVREKLERNGEEEPSDPIALETKA